MENKKKIKELIDGVVTQMEEKKYVKISIDAYRPHWKTLLEFVEENGIEDFTLEVIENFLHEKYGLTSFDETNSQNLPYWKVKVVRRSVGVLYEYKCTGTIKRKQSHPRSKILECFLAPTEAFLENCMKRCNSESTILWKKKLINAFLWYLYDTGTENVSAIGKEQVLSYLRTLASRSQRTIASTLNTLKQYFEFLSQEKYTEIDISKGIPKANHGRTGKLPNIWKSDQIEKLLNSIDRADPVGKRDYAILLLVTHLGLRESDVQNLTFENLCWQECCIRLIQSKTGRPLELPLDQKVGEAIIDYLKYGRPLWDKTQYVFVRHKAPFGKCNNYFHVMRKYLSAAGIPFDREKSHGLHTLRYSLATKLLEHEVPIETISEILGHVSVNTTKIYLHADLETLRQCALNPDDVGGEI